MNYELEIIALIDRIATLETVAQVDSGIPTFAGKLVPETITLPILNQFELFDDPAALSGTNCARLASGEVRVNGELYDQDPTAPAGAQDVAYTQTADKVFFYFQFTAGTWVWVEITQSTKKWRLRITKDSWDNYTSPGDPDVVAVPLYELSWDNTNDTLELRNVMRHHYGTINLTLASSDVKSMFKVTKGVDDGTFYVSAGTWNRNGRSAFFTESLTYDPIVGTDMPDTTPVITGTGTEEVFVYARLLRSDASGGVDIVASYCDLHYAEPSMSSYIPTGPAQFKLLAKLTYSEGLITEILYAHVGAIQDETAPLFAYGTTDFSVRVNYQLHSLGKPTLEVSGGGWKTNNVGLSVTKLDATELSDYNMSVYVDVTSTSPMKDPSLVPVEGAVKLTTAATLPSENGYGFWYHDLFEARSVEFVVSAASATMWVAVFTRYCHPGGEFKHDWVRPDGKPIGGNVGTIGYVIDNDFPMVQSMDFVTSGPHEGELQDYQVYETLTDSMGPFRTGNLAVPFFAVNKTLQTMKRYCFVDTSRAVGQENAFSSIEIYDDGSSSGTPMQLFRFNDMAEQYSLDDLATLYSGGSGDPTILVRDTYQLKYMKLKILATVAPDTITSIYAGDTSDLGTGHRAAAFDHKHGWDGKATGLYDNGAYAYEWFYEMPVPSHAHGDHTGFNLDDHNGSPAGGTVGRASYLILDGLPSRNNCSGEIGDGSGISSIDPDIRMLNNTSGAATLGWSSDITFSAPNIYYASSRGQSIPGWTTLGGLTGTQIYEITLDQMLPNDTFLVRRQA